MSDRNLSTPDNTADQVNLNINSFSSEDCSLFSEKGKYFLILLMLAVFGCFTNLTFIYIVAKQPSLRKAVLAIYLVSLSVIDIAICISYIVLILSCRGLTSGAFPDKAALFIFANPHTLHVLAISLMILIARQRYTAVSKPLNTYTSNQTSRTKLVVLLSLFLVISFLVLDVLYIVFVPINDIYVTVWIYMPLDGISLVVSITMYIIIFYKVKWMPTNYTDGKSHPRNDRNRRILRNITAVLFISTVTFFVMVFFQDVIFLAAYLGTNVDPLVTGIISFVWVYLSILNSSINPIIYNIFGSVFRHAVLETFPCLRCWHCRRRSRRNVLQTGITQTQQENNSGQIPPLQATTDEENGLHEMEDLL